MSVKKLVLIVLTICTLFAGAAVAYWAVHTVDRRPQGATVVTVFRSSGAKFRKLEVNGWVPVKARVSSEQEARDLLTERLHRVSYDRSLPLTRLTHENGVFSARVNSSLGRGVTAVVALQQYHGDRPFGSGENFLAISLAAQDPAVSCRQLEALFDAISGGGPDCRKSTVVSGYLEGRVQPWESSQIIEKMLNAASAQKLAMVSEGPLVSISAYSSRFPEWLTDGKKSVNINMALRYNSVENRTFLYVGSPLITSEY